MDKITIVAEDSYVTTDELYAAWFRCPKCSGTLIADMGGLNYCPGCGVPIKIEYKDKEKFKWINITT